MYNPNASGGNNTVAGNRLFVYEVEGLGQDGNGQDAPIRRSGTQTMTVPYNRMNEEMQRITRLGGKIVNIRPLTGEDWNNQAASANGSQAQESKPAEASKSMTQAKPETKGEAKGKTSAKASEKKKVPVNIYRPKNPFVGKCLSNEGLVREGVRDEYNILNLTSPLETSNTLKVKASASSLLEKTTRANPTSCVCILSPRLVTAMMAMTRPCLYVFGSWSISIPKPGKPSMGSVLSSSVT